MPSPARRAIAQLRGDINSTGQFRINDRWVYGWDGTIITDKSYYQDYGFYKFASAWT